MTKQTSPTGRKNRIWPYVAVTVLIMAFIFWQSSLAGEASEKESNAIVLLLGQWLRADPERVSFAVRKTAHFMEYLALGVSLAATVRAIWQRRASGGKLPRQADVGSDRFAGGSGRAERRKHSKKSGLAGFAGSWMSSVLAFLPPWVIGTAYAVSDEVHQFFVPGRSCEPRDMFIDSCGVAAGVLIMLLVRRVAEK